MSWNYEFGGHISCDGGRVYSTFSAFFIDVRDQQVTVFPEGISTGRMMTNAGRTRSFGAELTVRYTPTPAGVSTWPTDIPTPLSATSSTATTISRASASPALPQHPLPLGRLPSAG